MQHLTEKFDRESHLISYITLQGSIDSQLDLISVQGGRLYSERKPSLTRSQTDSNITYMSDEIPEAPGSACYITKEGDLDLHIVLKVTIRHCTFLISR
jgi:hypothetical protein